jgi:N-acetyl-anhydromuramyl-L-alanine amidase AmpD
MIFRTLRLPVVFLLLFGGGTLCITSYRNSITPAGIIVHHAALPARFQDRDVDVETIDHLHEQRGYGAFYWGRVYHVGYHYVILPDGIVQQGRPEHCRGAHAAGYESFLGICLIGNFSSGSNPDGDRGLKEPTKAQLQALAALVQRLRETYHLSSDRIRQHRDVNPDTECPGDRFPRLMTSGRFID